MVSEEKKWLARMFSLLTNHYSLAINVKHSRIHTMPIIKDGGIVTMQQHVVAHQMEHPTATGDFSWLLGAITLSTKIIASYVRRAGLVDVIGATGQTNVQGEPVQKLDQIAHTTLQRTLAYRGNVGVVASGGGQRSRACCRSVGRRRGNIARDVLDPLDGSSNIDVNVSVGTIFTILERLDGEKDVNHSVLQQGLRQLAAGYVVYGPSTVMVYTTGNGVHMFTLDPQFGAYLLTAEKPIKMPAYKNEYSVNEAYLHTFPGGVYSDIWIGRRTRRAGRAA